jgi:hypothetical protein
MVPAILWSWTPPCSGTERWRRFAGEQSESRANGAKARAVECRRLYLDLPAPPFAAGGFPEMNHCFTKPGSAITGFSAVGFTLGR